MCKEKYISPFTDFGFKRLFGTESNKEFLISFLNALFGDDEDPIDDINYGNVEKLGMRPDERTAVFDLYCTTKNHDHLVVEMQNGYQRYFMDRSIFYSSYPMQEAAQKGDWNFKLPKIYTVAFLNFRMSEYTDSPEFKHVVKLADVETGKVFYDKLAYYYLEMPKFCKDIDELETIFDKWMYVIKNMNELDSYPERIKERIFRSFFESAKIAAFTPEERMAYEISLKSLRDFNNTMKSAEWKGEQKGLAEGLAIGREEGLAKGREEGLAKGREEGRAEGEAEGRTQAIIAMAKNMLNAGMPIEQIQELTGIEEAELKKLKE